MNNNITTKYQLNVLNRTLTISKAFEKNLNDLESAEYKFYEELLERFPNLKVNRRTHATPSSYKVAGGRVKNHPTKGITLERMENFINALPNNEELVASFKYHKEIKSSYSTIYNWFIELFPNYRTNPLSYYKEYSHKAKATSETTNTLSLAASH